MPVQAVDLVSEISWSLWSYRAGSAVASGLHFIARHRPAAHGLAQVTWQPPPAMCNQPAPQAALLSAAAPADVLCVVFGEQRPAAHGKTRRRGQLPIARSTVRSLSALALMDCSAANPYSSWADSYHGKGPDAAPSPLQRPATGALLGWHPCDCQNLWCSATNFLAYSLRCCYSLCCSCSHRETAIGNIDSSHAKMPH